MAFIRMKGVEGLVYVPQDDGGLKKHPCEDCYFCQWCSDNRCDLCLKAKSCKNNVTGVDIITLDSIKRLKY
jgi:hypothetical protein